MKCFKCLLYALLLLPLTAYALRAAPPISPLPPQNKEVGDKWPPEVREFVEVFSTRFADGQPIPSETQIQQWLHVRTQEKPVELRLHGAVGEREIRDWPLGFANDQGHSDYAKSVTFSDSDRRQYMRVTLRVDTSRYCINPYDLAIYTGFHFDPESPRPMPLRPRYPGGKFRDPGYAWGMFNRSLSRTYLGNHFLKIVLTEDLRCIEWFRSITSYRPATKE